MPRNFRLLPLGVEGQYFKSTQEGWVFGAPKPWLSYRPRPAYLVTDAQRAVLANRIRLSRYLRLPLAIPLAAVIFLLPDLMPSSTRIELSLIAVVAYIEVSHLVEYLMVRPLIGQLPIAAERMTLLDMQRQQSRVMSVRAQSGLCAFFGLVFAGSLACLPFGTPQDREVILYVVWFSGAFFFIWICMLIAKIRSR